MTDEIVLRSVELEAHHKPSGRTRHLVEGKKMLVPSSLSIVRYEGDAGVYLLYLSESGEEMTDTYHDTIEEAMSQAEFEFGVLPHEWCEESEHA